MDAWELRIRADAILQAQAELLKLGCQLRRAAWDAADDALDEEEARGLLAAARKWLGPTVEPSEQSGAGGGFR